MRRFTGAILVVCLFTLPVPAFAGIDALVLSIQGMSCAF